MLLSELLIVMTGKGFKHNKRSMKYIILVSDDGLLVEMVPEQVEQVLHALLGVHQFRNGRKTLEFITMRFPVT